METLVTGTNSDGLRVFCRHQDYIMMEWLWKKMRLLLSGSEVVKTWDISIMKGKPDLRTFLLKPADEPDEQYAFFVYSARYSDFVSRSRDILDGLLFYRDPLVKVPGALKAYLSNIDMNGTSLVEFAKNIAGEILTINRGGLYVDYPTVPEGLTQKQAIERGARPFMKFETAERVFYWEYHVIDNMRVLTRVDIAEETDDDWDKMNWHLIRSLTLERNPETGAWEYWNTLYEVQWSKELERPKGFMPQFKLFHQLGSSGKEGSGYLGTVYSRVCPRKQNEEPFSRIPFWFTSLVYDQLHVDKAVLNAVADANIAHYRISADIQSALFHCAHPTPVFCGFDFTGKDKVLLGSLQGITSNKENARAYYLELTGQSIAELRKERDSIVSDLAALGARSLSVANASSQTAATTTEINSSGDTAVLNTLAGTMDSILTAALKVMAEFQGEDPEQVSLDMNRDFMPSKLASNEIAVLLNAVLQKALPIEDFIEILTSSGTMRQSITTDEVIKRLRNPPVQVGVQKNAANNTPGSADAVAAGGLGEGSTQKNT